MQWPHRKRFRDLQCRIPDLGGAGIWVSLPGRIQHWLQTSAGGCCWISSAPARRGPPQSPACTAARRDQGQSARLESWRSYSAAESGFFTYQLDALYGYWGRHKGDLRPADADHWPGVTRSCSKCDSAQQRLGNRRDPLNQTLWAFRKHFVYSVNSQLELCILIRFSRSGRNLTVIQSDPSWFSGSRSVCCLVWIKAPRVCAGRATLGRIWPHIREEDMLLSSREEASETGMGLSVPFPWTKSALAWCRCLFVNRVLKLHC